MILKTSLHIHTKEDKKDGHMIGYDVFQLVDEAKSLGFQVLGYTPHKKFVFRSEYAEYAKRQGVILIPGVELNLGRVSHKHVIVLNCDASVDRVKNFKQLLEYKKAHPEIFILSPHPTYSRIISIGARNLRKYISLFDAVEHSWLYSFRMNKNRKAERIAREHSKPMIATADVHVLKKLDSDYALLTVEAFNTAAILDAIRNGDFVNVSFPKKYFDLVFYITSTVFKYSYMFIEQKILQSSVKQFLPARVEE